MKKYSLIAFLAIGQILSSSLVKCFAASATVAVGRPAASVTVPVDQIKIEPFYYPDKDNVIIVAFYSCEPMSQIEILDEGVNNVFGQRIGLIQHPDMPNKKSALIGEFGMGGEADGSADPMFGLDSETGLITHRTARVLELDLSTSIDMSIVHLFTV